MQTITLTAHYDGQQILLDEPFPLPVEAKLLVTVLPVSDDDLERQEWYALSKAGLARAYGDDEPDYSSRIIQQPSTKP